MQEAVLKQSELLTVGGRAGAIHRYGLTLIEILSVIKHHRFDGGSRYVRFIHGLGIDGIVHIPRLDGGGSPIGGS